MLKPSCRHSTFVSSGSLLIQLFTTIRSFFVKSEDRVLHYQQVALGRKRPFPTCAYKRIVHRGQRNQSSIWLTCVLVRLLSSFTVQPLLCGLPPSLLFAQPGFGWCIVPVCKRPVRLCRTGRQTRFCVAIDTAEPWPAIAIMSFASCNLSLRRKWFLVHLCHWSLPLLTSRSFSLIHFFFFLPLLYRMSNILRSSSLDAAVALFCCLLVLLPTGKLFTTHNFL